MSECGCPLAELYAKAAQERDALAGYVGKLQKELEDARAEAADWHGAYEQSQKEVARLRFGDGMTIETKEGD